MPLESCMILLDDTQFMRNGDYIPTRYEAQQDAANLIVGAKTQSNPQTTIGICSGSTSVVVLSPTDSIGDILTAIHECRLQPQSTTFDICTAVAVASLALKHRQNKNGAQRIVAFCGTPITCEDKALIKTGKMLKKNNVTIDIIIFGEHDVNTAKLQVLVDTAAGGSLVAIPTGVLASDVLVSSPILADVVGNGGGGGGGSAAAMHVAEFGGVDPNMDPELAMALRVSMEEERARQERAALAAAASANNDNTTTNSNDTTATTTTAAAVVAAAPPAIMLSEEEAMLQHALAMSMNENEPMTTTESAAVAGAKTEQDEEEEEDDALMADDEMDEDSAMQMALQMSLQNQGEFQDPAFVQGMLDNMKEDDDDDAGDDDDDKMKKDDDDNDNK